MNDVTYDNHTSLHTLMSRVKSLRWRLEDAIQRAALRVQRLAHARPAAAEEWQVCRSAIPLPGLECSIHCAVCIASPRLR